MALEHLDQETGFPWGQVIACQITVYSLSEYESNDNILTQRFLFEHTRELPGLNQQKRIP